MDGGRMGRGATLVAAITLGTLALLAGSGPDAAAGRPRPTEPPAPPTSWIYAYQRMVPAGWWAVAPDGSATRVATCAGDRQHGTPAGRVVTVVDVAGETYPVLGSTGVTQVARQRLVTRDGACGDERVAWEVPAGVRVDYPTWSQDGARIAVRAAQYDGGGIMTAQGIWVGDLDGSCGPGLCGTHLAVPFPMAQTGSAPGGEPLYVNLGAIPRWSVDGRTVVYSRLAAEPVPDRSGAYLGDVGAPGSSGTAGERRIPLEGEAVSPVFSPVDDRIAFLHPNRTSACRLNDLLITTRDGAVTPVIVGSALSACAIGGFDWSPDGASIAFNATSKSLARDDVWTIRVGASKATLVLSTPGAFYWVSGWR
jgi:hypothetical protein